MRNAGLDEEQAGFKIAGRNIYRYVDDSTLVAESKEELKILLMKVKEESEKAGLNKTQHSKTKIMEKKKKTTKIMAPGFITPWQIDGGKSGNSDRFYFLGVQNHCGW